MAKRIVSDFDIMTQILKSRYTDLKEEQRLSLQLLDFAEKRQNKYVRAFAYVYLFDSALALGEYDSCDDYLSQALYLSRENKYNNLLMTLCNFAGLYYIRLNDEQSALQYFLEGLHLADDLGDIKTNGMLYNNMGLAFAGRGDWKTAKDLFKRAYQTVDNSEDGVSEQKIISYLSNYAESCLQIGEMEHAKEALKRCDSLNNQELYYQIRIGCEWSSYYAKTNQKEKCLEHAQKMLDLHIEEYNNKYFICDMIEDLSLSMLSIQVYDWAKKFIDMLNELVKDAPPVIRFRAQCAKIHYLEAIGEDASKAYEAYYYIDKEMSQTENKVRLQSILSVIQLHEVLKERDEMQFEKAVLENVVQIDELTGLYNRRYFNKLSSKIIADKREDSLGIIMIDVDYFKQYNDFYGHFKGDAILRKVGALLKKYSINGITPCRYGGDEFVCLCDNISCDKVDEFVKNIYYGIKEENITHNGSPEENYLTFSIGYVYSYGENGATLDNLLSFADQALYKVKNNGRNNYFRIEV